MGLPDGKKVLRQV